MADAEKIVGDVYSEIADTFNEFTKLEKKVRKGTASSSEVKKMKKLGKSIGIKKFPKRLI